MTEKTESQTYSDEFLRIKRKLQEFQQTRLLQTYEDLRSNPEYKQIGAFFFEELYAPEDFSFRDKSIKTLRKVLSGVVYKGMVSAVGMVIELHELSDRLDNRMVEKMIQNQIGENLTMDQYKMVYRLLDNYDERVYQIKLSIDVNRAFHRLSKKWIVGVSLKTVRAASHMLGVGDIMDFVNRGYEAFRQIDNIDEFVNIIEKRELEWHDKVWKDGENLIKN